MTGNTITISVLANTGPGSKGLDGLAAKMDRIGGRMSKIGGRIALAGGVVLGAAVAWGKKLESAGEAAGTADARIAQITKSMGQFGDRYQQVAGRVSKVAEKMARQTGIDPNSIKQAQATLSTFSSLEETADRAGGAFDRATKASADLSAAGFGSVESASVMLGKALQDPVTGMSALRRVGVTLSDAQQAQVKAFADAGNAAGAQDIVLKAVEKQVGGTAKATANASDQMKVSWQLAQEQLGKKLLPVFGKLRDAGLRMANWVADNADTIIAWGKVLIPIVAAITAFGLALKGVGAALQAWSTITKIASGVQLAFNAIMAANPIGLLILAIAALVAGLVWFFTQTKIGQQIVQAVWTGIQVAIAAVVDWFQNTAVPFLAAAWTLIVATFQAARAKVAQIIAAILAVIKALWDYSPLGLIVNNWGRILAFLGSIPGKVGAIFRAAITWLVRSGTDILTGMLNGAKNGYNTVSSWLGGMGSRILGALGNYGSFLYRAGVGVVTGFLNGLKSMWSDVQNWFGKLTDKIPSWKGPAKRDRTLLTGAGKLIMGSLVTGLGIGRRGVERTLSDLTDLIGGSLDPSTGVGLGFGDIDLAGASPRTVVLATTVQAQMLNPTRESGRIIAAAMDEWNRVNGKRS